MHTPIVLDGRDQLPDDGLCVAPGDPAIEAGVRDVFGAAVQCGDVDGDELVAALGLDDPGKVQVPEFGGVKVEVLRL